MATERAFPLDPRLAGLAQAIGRMIPLAGDDGEAKRERKLAHRIDVKKALE